MLMGKKYLPAIKVQPTCRKCASATAHTHITRKEIGHICMTVDTDTNCLQIVSFGVKKEYRAKGVGRLLLEPMIAEVKRIGGNAITVYPRPECDDEEPLDIETLYRIYERLGFTMDNPAADYKRYGNKMTMHL